MAELTARDMSRLALVHPSLVAVIVEAARTCPINFMVVEGVRSKETMWLNWGKGRTVAQCVAAGVPSVYAKPGLPKVTWLANPLNSNHRLREDGFGRAADLLPAPYDWKDPTPFAIVAAHMLKASNTLKVPIRWGKDWDRDGIAGEKGETDSPHFELWGV